MEIGLSHHELLNFVTTRVVEIAASIDHETPPRSPDVYKWVEDLFGHNGRVYSQAIIDVIDENNRRIAQQLFPAP